MGSQYLQDAHLETNMNTSYQKKIKSEVENLGQKVA